VTFLRHDARNPDNRRAARVRLLMRHPD
jgi:hypothetical protein